MNILTKAIEKNDLDEALKLVMDALGIESGDVAGCVFSSRQDANADWRDSDLDERHGMLAKWLAAECDDAGAQAKRQPWIIAVYLVDQAYGGPEDGGWYYRCASRVTEPFHPGQFENDAALRAYEALAAVTDLPTLAAAEINRDALQEMLDAGPNACRRSDIGSVLSEGRYEAEIYDGEAPNHYPATKPHYE